VRDGQSVLAQQMEFITTFVSHVVPLPPFVWMLHLQLYDPPMHDTACPRHSFPHELPMHVRSGPVNEYESH
jgi:hypothetical protein